MMGDPGLGSKERALTPERNPETSNGQTCKPGPHAGRTQAAFSP